MKWLLLVAVTVVALAEPSNVSVFGLSSMTMT